MSEQPYFNNHDKSRTMTPLRALNGCLADPSKNFSGITIAFQEYLKKEATDELADDSHREWAASQLYAQLANRDVLPNEQWYDVDKTSALEAFRMAIFTEIMPLYSVTHASEEFAVWLPQALQLAIDSEGRHHPDVCYYDDIIEGSCKQALTCPVRTIAYHVADQLVMPDFDTFDYLVDPIKARENTHTLLQTAVQFRIIPDAEKDQLTRCYEANYQNKFLATHR